MALTRSQRPVLRGDSSDPHRVSWLELFFDLVYVAALIQLGDRLAGDVSWDGVFRFLGAFVVLWWTWTGTTIFVNRFAVDDVLHRLLTFAQMWAVGTLAVVAASTNIDDSMTWFVFAYVGARLPTILMYLRVRSLVAHDDPIVSTYLVVFAGGATLWLASLALPEDARPFVWAVALAIEFAVPISVNRGRPSETPIHDEQLQERYALFTIIVLGETFVKTLSEITATGISFETNVFGGLSFALLVACWWTYFDDVAGTDVAPRSALARKPATNRLWWVYVHLPLAAGLTSFGVASKKLIGVDDLGADLKASYSWLLAGALATVFIAVAVLDTVTVSPHVGVRTGARVGLRIGAAAAILLLGVLLANGVVTAVVGVGLMAIVVVGQIAGEVMIAKAADRRIDENVAGAASHDGACDHLLAADLVDSFPSPGDDLSCRHCHEHGVPWVQLRLCVECGHIGCCDDSPGRHAREHHERTGHLVIATVAEGGEWAYCFEHEVTDAEWWRDRV